MTATPSLPSWLDQRAATSPNHPAVIADGSCVTFAELALRAQQAAGRLAHLGVGCGDRVAVLLRNGVELVEIMHGLMRLGAVLVPLHRRLTARDLGEQLRNASARVLLYDASAHDLVAEIDRRELAPLRAVGVGNTALAGDDVWTNLPGSERVAAARLDLTAEHTIIYTSGSAGRPKGTLLTYGNHLWSAVGSAFNLGVHIDDRWLACLPFCHVGGLSILLRAVIYGITAVIHDGFDPERVNRSIDADRVTMVSVVANMLQRMLDARGERPYPSWLRCVLLGGGPAPLSLLQACAGRGVPVVQTYGLTEAASQVATLAPRDALCEQGSAGKALLGTEVSIEGPDGPVPRGEVGEIVVRGPTVSTGYVGCEARRAGDGLHTGDLGRFDEEGFLYVLGRRDDMIISGGENIYPAEIEAALLRHPAVAEACVFGVPDPRWGQIVAASVRLRAGAMAGVQEIDAHARQELAGFKIPRLIRLAGDFPRTAAGKILRHRVQQLTTR